MKRRRETRNAAMGHGHGHSSKSMESFGSGSIPKVVIKNCIPALIAMVMVMVYNLADTFFISMTHDDLQIAAVSLGTPVFMIFMSLGTLFGVGGTSVISRALGAGKTDYAKKVSAFCMWSCVAVGLAFMALLWAGMDSLTVMLGASEDTMAFTRSYLTITVGCGVFSMISNCFSNVIRTEGEPMKAMTGTVIGNLLNIILDPIMILGLGWGITGAAVATVIGKKHIYKEYIGVDACAANLMRPAVYGSYHHVTVLGKEDAPLDHVYDVVGSLCENCDKFAVDRNLPKIDMGDYLVLHDTGAHGYSMGYNYNGKLRSAELLLKEDGSVQMIRRAETPADYFATFDCFDDIKITE